MLRAVLAVLVAVGLIAAATPGIEAARAEHSAGAAEGQLDRIAGAARALVEEEEPGPPGAAARRAVPIDLPARGRTGVGIDYVAVGGVPDGSADGAGPGESVAAGTARRDTTDGDVLAYRLSGRPPVVRRIPFDLRVASGGRTLGDDAALVLGPGDRLVLRLVRRGGDSTILAGRDR